MKTPIIAESGIEIKKIAKLSAGALLGRHLGAKGEKVTKHMVRDCRSRALFWSTFWQKTDF
jgi:hypothetical protein